MIFYTGIHHPSDGKHFERVFISVNTIRNRRKPIGAVSWIMDSGAFTELSNHGHYRHSVEDYAAIINRWSTDPTLVAAVAQDYMCEPFILAKTGLSIAEHQRLTIERYDALMRAVNRVYIIPVLQGYEPHDYLSHLQQYGYRLPYGALVGVGSVCKRNTNVPAIESILLAIKSVRPDLRLHGFGLKITALKSAIVRECLHSSDSMAWSFAARVEGRDANDWREAAAYTARVERIIKYAFPWEL